MSDQIDEVRRGPLWCQVIIVCLSVAMLIQFVLHAIGSLRLGAALWTLFILLVASPTAMLVFNTTALDPFSKRFASRSVDSGRYWVAVLAQYFGAAILLAVNIFVLSKLASLA